MEFSTIKQIQKENIPGIDFLHREALNHPAQIERRRQLLEQAVFLGNSSHTKVKIVFESVDAIYQVETTLWAATEDYVLLKGWVYLPVRCIVDVTII